MAKQAFVGNVSGAWLQEQDILCTNLTRGNNTVQIRKGHVPDSWSRPIDSARSIAPIARRRAWSPRGARLCGWLSLEVEKESHREGR